MEVPTLSTGTGMGRSLVTTTALLLKLTTAQRNRSACENPVPRRDSLSSSRTGDSGYISDPDLSVSPVDYTPVDFSPYGSSDFTSDSSALFDVLGVASSGTRHLKSDSTLLGKRRHLQRLTPALELTPCPPPTSDPGKDWKLAFKNQPPTSSLETAGSSRHEDINKWVSRNLQPQRQVDERKPSIASISSTGSCEMYSNCDNSDDDEVLDVVPNTLSKATLATIELIMRKIESHLGYAAYVQRTGSSRIQGTNSTRGSSGRASTQSNNSGNGKRKSNFNDSLLPPDDPDEDSSNKRRRVSVTTTEDSDTNPRFACPFFKHDPNRYGSRRTCPGPGWPTVHRMKEHLYRSHAQPIFCPRCYAMFDSDTEFSTHLRSVQCQVSDSQPVEGIRRETLKALKKRSSPGRLEEDKWRDTYQLLFPEVAEEDIPSPYYDSASPTEESRRFRRELLDRVRRELFATAEREPGHVEQRLLRQVASIIQRCEDEILESFNLNSESSRRPSIQAPLFDSSSTSNVTRGPTPLQLEPQSPRSVVPIFEPPPEQLEVHVNSGQHQGLASPLEDLSGFIDWDVVFPPGLEMQGSEKGATFSTPVW